MFKLIFRALNNIFKSLYLIFGTFLLVLGSILICISTTCLGLGFILITRALDGESHSSNTNEPDRFIP